MVEFRTIDGSDNNPSNLGEAESQLLRLLKPAYEDGYYMPRGITKIFPGNDPRQVFLGTSKLPNPREISNTVSSQSNSALNFLNASDWLWQWGQFLDHDLDLNEGGREPFFIPVNPNDPIASNLPKVGSEQGFVTKNGVVKNEASVILPLLDNIPAGEIVPVDELVPSQKSKQKKTKAKKSKSKIADPTSTEELSTPTPYLPLTRVPAAPGTGTEADNPRQHINEITAFIDGSQVYGSDEKRAIFLRANDATGKLKSQTIKGEELLPYNIAGLPNAGGEDRKDLFIAGDVRANEQVGLMAAHTLFVREHNRLAEELAQKIAAGDSVILRQLEKSGLEKGDFIYESTRKVIGAQIQVITYNEYLPILIGSNLLDDYSGYDPSVDPGISQEFANAGYRLGHSQLSPEIQRVNPDGTSAGSITLGSSFFSPHKVIKDGADSLLLGLTTQVAQEVDNQIVDGVRNFLFPAGTGGFDLAAVNIQRGRDVGLPSYNDARVGLGLKPVTAFLTNDTELGITSDPEVAARFAAVYDSVDQVDFWLGGISEDPVKGGLVGELFSKVLTDQFKRLRDGDRFFYLNDLEHLLALDPDLESTTLADLLRRNTSKDFVVQQNAFIVPDLAIDAPNGKNGSKIAFTVSLSDVSSAVVTVDFKTIDGIGTAGKDYINKNGTLTFQPGETTKTVAVQLHNNAAVLQKNKTVLVQLSSASNQNISQSLAPSKPIFQKEIGGSSSDDSLKGSFKNDLIEGWGGNDKLYGGFGNDYLDGGEANDILNGDFNFSKVKGLKSKFKKIKFKKLILESNDTQLGGDGHDKLNGGFGDDTQLGGDGDDVIKGDFNFGKVYKGKANNLSALLGIKNKGKGKNKNNHLSRLLSSNDIQFGGSGNDTLHGGFGSDELTGVGDRLGVGEIDHLTGGFGKDTFVLGDEDNVFYLGKGAFDYALIKDFKAKQDTIELHGELSDYVLASTKGMSLPKGTGLYRDLDGSGDLTPGVDDLIAISTEKIAKFKHGFNFV